MVHCKRPLEEMSHRRLTPRPKKSSGSEKVPEVFHPFLRCTTYHPSEKFVENLLYLLLIVISSKQKRLLYRVVLTTGPPCVYCDGNLTAFL